eukprot:7370662-Pyramimonas_sp.AAC.1
MRVSRDVGSTWPPWPSDPPRSSRWPSNGQPLFFMLDAASALSRAIRELVMQMGTSDSDLHVILATAGFTTSATESFKSHIAQQATILEAA